MESTRFLSIGGGPEFNGVGWSNLEAVVGNHNKQSFVLGPACTFPYPDSSIQLVYSSHCFEHLDPPTVSRVLDESKRVMIAGGKLIIKLPDFELVQRKWKLGDEAFFGSHRWGFDAITNTWANKGVMDCLDNRAAMVFCGFWNESYGDHFSRKIKDNPKAYHGPPNIPAQKLIELRDTCSPSELSGYLREFVLEKEGRVAFNHQTAWSRKEFADLLEASGFRVLSSADEYVMDTWQDIPEIVAMADISMYFAAEKPQG